MSPATRPQFDCDFTQPEINHDPWPHLEELRKIAPAVWNPPSNSWIVTSYDDVRAILANDEDYAPATDLYAEIFGDPSILGAIEPRHGELRGLWYRSLTRSAVQKWAGLVGQVCDEHLDPILELLRDGEVVDVAPRLKMVPTELIARSIGVPVEDCPQFMVWGEALVAQFDVYTAPNDEEAAKLREAGIAATKAMNAYCGEQLELRRRSGRTDDLLGQLATTEVPMTEQEKRAFVTVFIEGAQDTTTKFLTSSLSILAQHPDQRSTLVRDRSLMAQTLEEVMRWQGPVSLDLRVPRWRDVEIGGVAIPQGDHVSPSLAAANRDPSRWEDPHAFDIFRPKQANLGFGFGGRSCLGVNVARLVATTLMNKVLDAIPEYKLADRVDYGRSFIIRGPVSLPLCA